MVDHFTLIPLSSITGLVLAGGQGSRMGGRDKGLLAWKGKPLARHALDRLQPQVGKLMLSANRNHDIYATWGCPVIGDLEIGFPGPLGGLQAGMHRLSTPYLAVTPCDTPDFPLDMTVRMGETLVQEGVMATWAVTEHGEHPVFMMCRREVSEKLDEFLAQGKRRVREFLQGVGGTPTIFDNESDFRNLNSPDELD